MKNSCFFISTLTIILLACHFSIKGQTNLISKSYSPSDGFVAHEWGTFTSLRSSDGTILSGLQKEEEALPNFVNNICFCYNLQADKGWPISTVYDYLKNVTIKMETPVIYFYSTEPGEKKVTVNVQFPRGTISQWYPFRSGGEKFLDPNFVLIGPYPASSSTVDFSVPYNGNISWDAIVLPKTDSSLYSSNPGSETKQWLAQRETASNLIKMAATGYYNSIEKFLFYRGMGNFTEPLNITFNSFGNLVISNNSKDKLSYVLVYERKRDSSVIVHWSGIISENTIKVIDMISQKSKDPAGEMEKFVSRLVAAGLYEDEARAMLNTWQKSYFEHEGLKVFWIVPPEFTEEVLPLNMNPQPDLLKRVLVGRSEILTPEFEKELMNLKGSSSFDTLCKNDRFGLAYGELARVGIPAAWTTYNTMTQDEEPSEDELEIKTNYSLSKNVEILPNPSSSYLIAKIYDNIDEPIFLRIFNTKGELVNSFSGIKRGENLISLEGLPAGMYSVKVDFADGKFISKKIIKL